MRARFPVPGRRFPAAVLAALAAPCAAQEVAELPVRDRALPLEREPVYTVGEIDGEPWEEFQSLTSAAFGADGRLYLFDGSGSRVVAVDAGGGFLHEVGREGEGPGEYAAPSGIAVLSDGRVAVWDFGARSFVVFGPDGEFLEEVGVGTDVGRLDDPLAVTEDDRILAMPLRVFASHLGHAYLTAEGLKAAADGLPLLSVSLAEGARARVVTRASLPTWRDEGGTPRRRVFEPSPSWGVLAGGRVALQHSDGYRIDVIGPDGRLERTLVRPLEPRPIDAAARRAHERALEARGGERVIRMGAGGGGSRPAPRDPPPPVYHPVVPPILEITADGADRIWVQRRADDDPTRPGPVDVLRADGRYLGTLDEPGLPAAFGPDGLVVFFRRGPLDVPLAEVQRIRIRPD